MFSKIFRSFKPAAVSSEADRKTFQTRMNDAGYFIYEADGFIYPFKDKPEKIRWTDIEMLATYKLDFTTVDEICMDIFFNRMQFTISEETPGWHLFIAKLQTVFPNIPKDWDGKITYPAFATNYTVLYERKEEAQ